MLSNVLSGKLSCKQTGPVFIVRLKLIDMPKYLPQIEVCGYTLWGHLHINYLAWPCNAVGRAPDS